MVPFDDGPLQRVGAAEAAGGRRDVAFFQQAADDGRTDAKARSVERLFAHDVDAEVAPRSDIIVETGGGIAAKMVVVANDEAADAEFVAQDALHKLARGQAGHLLVEMEHGARREARLGEEAELLGVRREERGAIVGVGERQARMFFKRHRDGLQSAPRRLRRHLTDEETMAQMDAVEEANRCARSTVGERVSEEGMEREVCHSCRNISASRCAPPPRGHGNRMRAPPRSLPRCRRGREYRLVQRPSPRPL